MINFSVRILQIFVKFLQVDILLWMTSSATGTGILVKRVLTSNETKISSGLMERFLILWMKSVLSLTKDGFLLR